MLSLFRGTGRIHYAWIVLAIVMILRVLNAGLRQAFGVFIDPLADQFGWSRGSISLAYSISFLSTIPITLIVGWLGETLGVRRVVMMSSLIVGFGLMLTGTITQLWQLYLYYGIIVSGLGSSAFVILMPVMVTRWFSKKTGLAMGLMWGSVGLGPLLMAPLLRWSIESSSWRTTFLVFGAAAGLIIFAISVLLRNHPRDMGLAAYGESTSLPDGSSPASSSVAMPISSLRSSYQFWALITIHFFGCVSHALVLAHVVSMATVLGIPGGAAAMTLSIISAVSIGSRFGMSMLADTAGNRNTLSIAMFLQTTPLFILLWAKSLWVFYLFAFLFGIGFGGEMVGFPIFNRQLYGDRAPLGTIYSYQMVGAKLGMAFGGWLGGSLFDLTGGYTWSIIVAIIAGYVGMVPILALPYHCRSSQRLPK